MSIVTRPFLLDFAGAEADVRPDFSPKIWTEWETQKAEQFGKRWKMTRAVVDDLVGYLSSRCVPKQHQVYR